MSNPRSPHALVIPFPGQSHITPMMQLSKLLSIRGFIITFVNNESMHSRIVQSQAQIGVEVTEHLGGDIRSVGIQDGFPAEHVGKLGYGRLRMDCVENMKIPVEELIEKLNEEGAPVSCIIADFLIHWAQDVADRFGIPNVCFWTTSAAAYALHCHVPVLIDEGFLPHKGTSGASNEVAITCIPGVMPLRPSDFPSFFIDKDVSDFGFQFMLRPIFRISEASWVIANSIYELETQAVDSIAPGKTRAPIFPVGPLLPLAFNEHEKQNHKESTCRVGTSILPEEDCNEWLDRQAAFSVLYISFGSIASLSVQQFQELALGLEESHQPFLWVIRPNMVTNAEQATITTITDVLPEGFMDRTKEKGVVISWAAQPLVLSHPSVGGFLTHCGWNSTIESVSLGVPMLAWPILAEQKMNARYMVDEWKIGMEFHASEGGLIEKKEVEKVIRRLMREQEGRQMRERASKWKVQARQAIEEGGSSKRNLDKFVEDMTRRALQR